MTRLMRRGWAAILFTTALLAGGCASDKSTIASAQSAHTELEPSVLQDGRLQAYMQKIGSRIVAEAKALDEQGVGPSAHKKGDTSWMFEDVEFHMVGSDTLNAFTTGGHHIYIYSELFTTAKSEDEFAAVCAHEFAHIYCRHVQQGQNRQYGVYAGAALAAVGGAALGGKDNYLTGAAAGGAAGLAAGQFVGMGYTRDDENEADKYGFRFYTRAGWEPSHFADFFQQMIDKGYDKTPEQLSDHPKLANRVENTKRRVGELPADAKTWRKPDAATPSEFASLQSAARSAARRMGSDKKTQAAELMLAAFPSCVAPTESTQQKAAQERIEKAAKKQKKTDAE